MKIEIKYLQELKDTEYVSGKRRKNPQVESGIEMIIGGCHISPLFFS